MHRKIIEKQLLAYSNQVVEDEKMIVERFTNFVKNNPDCFERSNLEGHITASALICSPDMDKILLIHHKKLQKWLQLGGHADGHPNPAEVSLKEAQEESGMHDFSFYYNEENKEYPTVFDLDIHVIPERPNEPQHFHYDLRFLLKASQMDIVANEEANDLRWFTIEDALKVTEEESMLRQFRKFQVLRDQFRKSDMGLEWKELICKK